MIDLSQLITVEAKQAAAAAIVKADMAGQLLRFNTDRADYLDALTGIAGRAWRANDNTTAFACDKVAEGLLVLKQQPEVLAAKDLPSLQRAMLLCYGRLLVDVPNSVKAVFNKVRS